MKNLKGNSFIFFLIFVIMRKCCWTQHPPPHHQHQKKSCMQSSQGPPDLYHDGVMNPSYMWYRHGQQIQVPVILDRVYSYLERRVILKGLKEIQLKTCIDFYIFNHTEQLRGYDYVNIVKKKGCWSHIGRVGGGKQELSLGRGCINHRTSVHEMIHALGFAHEHVRSDRDQFVHVFWQNIQKGRESNFAKRNTKSTDPYGPYDYKSVMHYDRKAFSKNGRDTIKPLKHGARIGVNKKMSPWDVKKLRRMYKCSGGDYGHGPSNSPGYSSDAALSNYIHDSSLDFDDEDDVSDGDDEDDDDSSNEINNTPSNNHNQLGPVRHQEYPRYNHFGPPPHHSDSHHQHYDHDHSPHGHSHGPPRPGPTSYVIRDDSFSPESHINEIFDSNNYHFGNFYF